MAVVHQGKAGRPNPFLAFDLTRLFIAPVQLTPRGIDRIDMGFARHFFGQWSADCVATLPTPWGVRCVSRKDALRILDAAETNWGETANPNEEALLTTVKRRLNGTLPAAASMRPRRKGKVSTALSLMNMLKRAGCGLGPLAASALPKGALYVNTGQVGIAIPRFLSWLERRKDVAPVFMLHDTIPIDHAEFVPPASRAFHQNMIANAARHAAGLIVSTEAAGKTVLRELRRQRAGEIPVIAERLPVSPSFAAGADVDESLFDVPYFLVVGSIEPRKNHLLILNVWRDIVRHYGAAAPKLIVAGSRWHKHKTVTDIIERSSALKDHVIEVGGLSTPALRRLISNARALLMPSFAEGFGLPIVEALSVGTPVIASDIPAHREAGGAHATYLSPIDGLGWLSEIQTHLEQQAAIRRNVGSYTIRSWAEYLQRIEPFLLAVHAREAWSSSTELARGSDAIAEAPSSHRVDAEAVGSGYEEPTPQVKAA